MNVNSFSPIKPSSSDVVASTLEKLAHGLLIVTIGLIPILFIPGILTTLGYVKVICVITAALISILLLSFSFLRSGTISTSLPLPLVALWVVAFVSIVSALLSGDLFDSLVGDTVPMLSAAGLTLVALLATLMSSLGKVPRRAIRLFMVLLVSSVILSLWHLSRLFFGPEFLSLGLFNSSTSSLLGGWNDVAIFYGLVVILSLIAVEQLTLSKPGKIFFAAIVGVGLLMLSVINFFSMWLVLGFLSLAFLMYGMTRHRFSTTPSLGFADSSQTLLSAACSALVFVTAAVFVIGGTAIGTSVTNMTGVSYVEVRPSFTATLDIARLSMDNNLLTGVGPNRFTDAWRFYKDSSINETIFWNTEFSTGHSFILTSIVETGVLGLVAWVSFLALFVWTGVRTFISLEIRDRVQYYILVASYTAGLYVWLMCTLYAPGVSIVLLGAVMTGIFFGSRMSLLPQTKNTISLENNRHIAFIFVGVVMALIVASLFVLYVSGRHFVAAVQFSKAVTSLQAGGDLSLVERAIASSYQYTNNDTYARELAWYQLAKMNSFLTASELSASQQQDFQTAVTTGLNAAQTAISKDKNSPYNYQVLGRIYAVLAIAGVEGARDRANEAYGVAKQLDPQNPLYELLEAQLLINTGEGQSGREKAVAAVQKKRNYTDALVLLANLDIAEGKVEDAIKTTQAIISIEPQNPSRYYQLGVLFLASKNLENAATAFGEALVKDQNFANARYYLGITLAQLGDKEGALRELRAVEELNPDNADLKSTISAIENNQVVQPASAEAVTAPETVKTSEDKTVTTSSDTETDLVSPVNVVPNEEAE